ncbi:hypothetical protein ES703_22016 [subsurface metagenome]
MKLLKGSLYRFLLIGILTLGLSFSLSGAREANAKLSKVRIGLAPYTMFQIWIVAHELGIDKEFGLDFEVKEFTGTLPGTQVLIRDDVDITVNCIAEHIAVIGKAPQVKNFSSLGFFKGFIYVGRKTEWKPFDDLVEGMGLEKAKESQLKQFRGKEFCIIPQRKPLVADTIAQVGLTLDDVKLLNFADDQKAAMAFMRGAGDIYMGSLPQERRLLKMSDQYVNLGGTEILGPAGLWYDTMVSTEKFMKENRETALRTIAALYRTIRLFDEQPEKVGKIGAAAISRMTGGEFSVEEYITMQTVYDDFLSIEELLAGMYNPYSPLYWKNPVEYYIKMAVEQGDLDEVVPAEDYYSQSEELFWELLKRKDLLQFIYAPFPS